MASSSPCPRATASRVATASSPSPSIPNDPNARVRFVVDTKGPRITGTDPLPGAEITPSGVLPVAIAVNENLDLTRLNASTIANSITVTRSGGDGVFGPAGTKPDVNLT